MKIINVNIMRHGDGKRVYVSVTREDGIEVVINADKIFVHIDKTLPNAIDWSSPADGPVLVTQEGYSHG